MQMQMPRDAAPLPSPVPPGPVPLGGSSRGGYASLGDLQLPSVLPSMPGLNSSVLFPFRDSTMVSSLIKRLVFRLASAALAQAACCNIAAVHYTTAVHVTQRGAARVSYVVIIQCTS